jgi:hypothetical protein
MDTNESTNLFTIDGMIQELHFAPGIVNLIENIQQAGFFTGMVAGLAEQPGLLANSASLATYDGEDVEHVALMLNDKLAIGTFEWARDLKVGDDVKLVVSKMEEGSVFIHAILRKNDHLLWTPLSVHHTRRGWVVHGIKLAVSIVVFIWIVFGSFYLIDGKSVENSQDWLMLVFSPIALITFVVFMSLQGVLHLGDQAEEIFKALAVPKYRRFRIKYFSVGNLNYMTDSDSCKKKYIFKFDDALAAHRKRFNLH